MPEASLTPKDGVEWEMFQKNLADYVRLELAGQAADEMYPELAFYLATSPFCEEAYYQEFHAQGLQKSVTDLQHVGQRAQVAPAMSHILAYRPRELPLSPEPNWVEISLEHGRAWLERTTKRWRQLQLTLPTLPAGAEGTTALAGFLSGDAGGASPVTGTRQIAPSEAHFELSLLVMPAPVNETDKRCILEVALTLHERFGNFAGIDLWLFWGAEARHQQTDSLGKAIFTDLPCDQLPAMQLIIRLPD